MVKAYVAIITVIALSMNAPSFAEAGGQILSKATIEEHILNKARDQALAIVLEKQAKTPLQRKQLISKIKIFPFFPTEKNIPGFPKPLTMTETDPALLAGYFSSIAKAYQHSATSQNADIAKDYELRADYYQALADALDPPLAVQEDDEELQ